MHWRYCSLALNHQHTILVPFYPCQVTAIHWKIVHLQISSKSVQSSNELLRLGHDRVPGKQPKQCLPDHVPLQVFYDSQIHSRTIKPKLIQTPINTLGYAAPHIPASNPKCKHFTIINGKPEMTPVLAITPSHQQNTHDFADGRKNMNDIFNNYVCSASHMRSGLHFQNV